MPKRTITLTIEPDIHDLAKKKLFNISGEFEAFLKKRCGKSMENKSPERECFKCSSNKDLIWLCPDEDWICEKCLDFDVRMVKVAVK